MKKMTGQEIRRAFLDFFVQKGHREVRSHALIPPNDPTLYFVNAGMVQFKDIFVGARQVDYSTAASCQKCLRVSGKHNDLENVGRTARHHTFFEMLGNFSFGDYFKRGAITQAWEFITEVLEMPIEHLHVTVHPEDDEARQIWTEISSLPPERIHDDPENFWQMADTGPCGPCSEIYMDLGVERSGGVALPFGHPDAEDRYMEFWNLVFMQYDRSAEGELTPLPKPSIDTGSGLERVALIMQGKETNYDTDLFLPLIEEMAQRAGVEYRKDDDTDVALRVIADHSRSAAFLIADGIYPDNVGRGYVLRRVMRRAVRFGRMLGVEEPFLIHTTAKVIEMMGDAYPELVESRETIHRVVLKEEKTFGRTINAGLKRLNKELEGLSEGGVLDGKIAFELYDTHGFPPDLTALICADTGVGVDQGGYDAAMEHQKETGRQNTKFKLGDLSSYQALVEAGIKTEFTGYDHTTGQSKIAALLVEGQRIPRAAAGQRLEIVVPVTPFYAESGGQIGDRGTMTTEDGSVVRIETTLKPFGDLFVHFGVVEHGSIGEGQQVSLEVNAEARDSIRKNHSATHLLHHALRDTLGTHVRQRGSMVAPDRLRFDFSHTEGVTDEELLKIEAQVNDLILRNEPVTTSVLPMDEALAQGAIAFFEEKYGDVVRMVKVGNESTELCGGIHVQSTGDIGMFKLVSEGGISSGVRRVEALTGMGAVRWIQGQLDLLNNTASALRVPPAQVTSRVEKLIAERKQLAKQLDEARVEARLAKASSAISQARQMGDFKVAAVHLEGLGGKHIRSVAEELRNQLRGSGVVLVVGTDAGKVSLMVAATKDTAKKLHGGKLVGELAKLVGGKGGGRPDFAQAGGNDAAGVPKVLDTFYARAESALA